MDLFPYTRVMAVLIINKFEKHFTDTETEFHSKAKQESMLYKIIVLVKDKSLGFKDAFKCTPCALRRFVYFDKLPATGFTTCTSSKLPLTISESFLFFSFLSC